MEAESPSTLCPLFFYLSVVNNLNLISSGGILYNVYKHYYVVDINRAVVRCCSDQQSNSSKDTKMSPDELASVLKLAQPVLLNKQGVVVNNRHNRTIRQNIIKVIVKSFARLNNASQSNFGLIKAKVNGKRFYYKVELLNNNLVVNTINNFPVGIVDAILESYYAERIKDAVGIIIVHNKIMPIILSKKGISTGAWIQ